MKYSDLIEKLNILPMFDMATVLQLFDEKPQSIKTQLYRLVKSGKLVALKRELYTFAAPYRQTELNPLVLANQLYGPSYLSGLWCLNFYGLIPEQVHIYSSVTTRTTRQFNNAFGRFYYHHIKADLFFGYSRQTIQDQEVWLATPEKALLDYFYLTSGEWSLGRLESLRFQQLNTIKTERLKNYLDQYKSPRLESIFKHWLSYGQKNNQEYAS